MMTDTAEERRQRRLDRLTKATKLPDRFRPPPREVPERRDRTYVSDAQAYELFSHITDATEDMGWSGGLTKTELRRTLGLSKSRFEQVFFHMRRSLGEDAARVVPIQDPDGEYRYRTCDDPAAAEQWVTRQQAALETRLETIALVLESCVTLTDGRTTQGRRYRMSSRAVRQALDVLSFVDEMESTRA